MNLSATGFSQPAGQQLGGTRRFSLGLALVTSVLAVGIAVFAVEHRHLALPRTNGKALGTLRSVTVRDESNGLYVPASPFSAIETTVGVYQVAGAVSGKFGEPVTAYRDGQDSVV